MQDYGKRIIKVGSTTNIAGETISFPATGGIPELQGKFKFMDILINITALTGTTPTMLFAIQERFSDAGFTETARTTALAATGKTFVTHEDSAHTGDVAKNAMLGKGGDKQIVTTPGGTVTAITADIYAIFYN